MWHYMTVTCNWLPDCDSMTFLWNYYAITMLFIAWNSLPSVGPSTSTSLEAPFFEVLKHQQMVIEPHPFRKRWSYMVIYGNIWWYLTFSHIISLEISTYSCNFGVLWPVPSRSSSHGTPRSVWISMDTPVFVVFFFLHSFPAFSSKLQLQCWHGKATIPSAWFVLRFPGSFVSLKPAECSKPPMCCMAWRIGWHL